MSWFVDSFGARYRQLYSHRDDAEATRALETLAPEGGWVGRSVLDLACGAGRYCRGLRLVGAMPVGVDLSAVLVAEAHAAEPGIDYLRADMRRIPLLPHAVDDCLSMFTSFGYFASVAEHARLAAEMARVASQRVIVDIPNPVVLEASLVPHSERELEQFLVRETRWTENGPARVCKRTELLTAEGAVAESYEESVMLFGLEQLREFFEPQGLLLERCHGAYTGADFSPAESPRQICVFQRSER